MSSETYRLPTAPIEVKLTLSGGRTEEAVFFLSPLSDSHSGPETLDEFLNKDRAFLAARSKESGRNFLVNRLAIVSVEASADAPLLSRREEIVATAIDLVRLELTAGAPLEGTLLVVGPPESSRVSDFFNLKETFVPLEMGERVVFVNKEHVLCVRL